MLYKYFPHIVLSEILIWLSLCVCFILHRTITIWSIQQINLPVSNKVKFIQVCPLWI